MLYPCIVFRKLEEIDHYQNEQRTFLSKYCCRCILCVVLQIVCFILLRPQMSSCNRPCASFSIVLYTTGGNVAASYFIELLVEPSAAILRAH